MTREQIMAMPAGPELDALVAEKVMGLKPACRPYSTSIEAAWEVVGELMDAKRLFIMHGGFGDDFEVCFNPDIEDSAPDDLWVKCSTAPLAICRAALLSVMEDKTP